MTTLAPPLRPPTSVRAVQVRWRSGLALAATSVLGVAAFLWPLFIGHGAGIDGHEADAPFIVAGLLALLLATVLAELADGGIDARALAMLGVLASAGSLLRLLDPRIALTEGMVFFLLAPAGRALGRGFGFLLGALTLFASALLTVGVGPWLPFQMLGAGWFAFGAGCLPQRVHGRAEVLMLAVYAVAASEIYGILLDFSFWPFRIGTTTPQLDYVPGGSVATNLHHFWAFHSATGVGWDLLRGFGTFVLVIAAGRPVLAALRRASRHAGFEEAP
ncbi:MAG TPA: ECF transporter S component [Mycobacteriales bacterium]|nr:ECF transporter S component [Mycobacteriales bacterium]